MTKTDLKSGQRMLVVHGTPLVAEDLREILLSAGAGEVALASTLPEDPLNGPFDTCFLSASSEALLESRLFDKMTCIAAHVVLIVGFLQAVPDLPPHFSILSEPFRDDDVLAALMSAGSNHGSAA